MSYREVKTIGAVLQEFQVHYREDSFVEPLPFSIPDYFRKDLHLMMREGLVDNSEFAICENLIYSVLKEVWKQHRQHFILWSHQVLAGGYFKAGSLMGLGTQPIRDSVDLGGIASRLKLRTDSRRLAISEHSR
jgi:hypothetical protein